MLLQEMVFVFYICIWNLCWVLCSGMYTLFQERKYKISAYISDTSEGRKIKSKLQRYVSYNQGTK